MALNFPDSPNDGDFYFDTTSGNRYRWVAANNFWQYAGNTEVFLTTFNTQTDDYTLVIGDAENTVEMNVWAAATRTSCNVTIPNDGNVPFSNGTGINIIQQGNVMVSFKSQTGVTLRYNPGANIANQHTAVTALKRSPNVWYLLGALEY